MLDRTMGYKAFPVSDGKQAAEKYLADPDKYDCILMDLDMPKMVGGVLLLITSGSDE